MGCFVVTEFLLTTASRGPSAIAEPLVKFGGPIHISGIAEARALKFYTKEVLPKWWQIPPKGAWICSQDPFCIHNCRVRKKSLRQSVICDQPCPRQRTADYHIFDGRCQCCHTLGLRPKLHRFDLSPCLLQTCLYNNHIENKSTKWSLSIIIQICGNNNLLSTDARCLVIILDGQCSMVCF